MTISQVQYVCEIAKRGSISRAAGQFYISQPALSEQIKALETELDASFSGARHVVLNLLRQGSSSAVMQSRL